jgi:hypothetical protein
VNRDLAVGGGGNRRVELTFLEHRSSAPLRGRDCKSA